MNKALLAPFSEEEVKKTLFQTVEACLRVLNGEASVREFNHTYTTLIPKIKNPVEVLDFRRQLQTNLKGFYRSAFLRIRARLSPVGLFLIMFWWIRKVVDRVRRGWQRFKLNMSKAYNRVEWISFRRMMISLGFKERWLIWWWIVFRRFLLLF